MQLSFQGFVLEFPQFIFDQPHAVAFRATFKLHRKYRVKIESRAISRALVGGWSLMLGASDRFHFNLKICFAAVSSDSFIPIRNMNVIYEIGKSTATHRHDLREFVIDQI